MSETTTHTENAATHSHTLTPRMPPHTHTENAGTHSHRECRHTLTSTRHKHTPQHEPSLSYARVCLRHCTFATTHKRCLVGYPIWPIHLTTSSSSYLHEASLTSFACTGLHTGHIDLMALSRLTEKDCTSNATWPEGVLPRHSSAVLPSHAHHSEPIACQHNTLTALDATAKQFHASIKTWPEGVLPRHSAAVLPSYAHHSEPSNTEHDIELKPCQHEEIRTTGINKWPEGVLPRQHALASTSL